MPFNYFRNRSDASREDILLPSRRNNYCVGHVCLDYLSFRSTLISLASTILVNDRETAGRVSSIQKHPRKNFSHLSTRVKATTRAISQRYHF